MLSGTVVFCGRLQDIDCQVLSSQLSQGNIVVFRANEEELRVAEYLLNLNIFARDPEHAVPVGYAAVVIWKFLSGLRLSWLLHTKYKDLKQIEQLCIYYRNVGYIMSWGKKRKSAVIFFDKSQTSIPVVREQWQEWYNENIKGHD